MPNVFPALGHGRFGMNGGPPSAKIMSNLVLRRPSPIDPAPCSAQR
jgi:D-amino-acid dehydrogenase